VKRTQSGAMLPIRILHDDTKAFNPNGLNGADTITGSASIEIAKGNIPGHSSFFKFGSNPEVGATFETIWNGGGNYVYPAAATAMTVSSSSAADDVGSTGATSILIEGLDANYALTTETVTMDGQNGVPTANQYIRVFRAYILTVGTGQVNAGDIYIGTGTITNGIPATVYAKIDADAGQTEMTVYTVPAGYTLYIFAFTVYSGQGKEMEFRGRFRPFGLGWRTGPVPIVYQSTANSRFEFGFPIPEKTDLEVQGRVTTGTAIASAQYEGILVTN